MRDQRLDKLANVLVNYSTAVKPGDLVSIKGDPVSMPLISAVFDAVLKAGGHPSLAIHSDELTESFFLNASDEQLAYLNPLDTHKLETIDVQIGLWADTNTRAFNQIDPARTSIADNARKPLFDRFMQRAADRSLRWCGTLYPTLASAQDAEMSLRQYEDFVFRAGLLHLPDPIAAWKQIHERQQRVVDFLQGEKQLRFRVPPHNGHDGTDLTVELEGATWINCAGTENFPDGEVFAGPQSVTGHVNYTFPAVHNGRETTDVRLAFRDGRVVDASASKNEDFLISMLDIDPGARTLGEIAIGTNYAIKDFSRNTLFDEKIGGTFHAAVGAGYPESGSTNESSLHWDMVCDLRPNTKAGLPGGTIEADSEIFHKDGRFLNEDYPCS